MKRIYNHYVIELICKKPSITGALSVWFNSRSNTNYVYTNTDAEVLTEAMKNKFVQYLTDNQEFSDFTIVPRKVVVEVEDC